MNGDGCSDCTLDTCGDGVVEAAEECDDGNEAQRTRVTIVCSMDRLPTSIPFSTALTVRMEIIASEMISIVSAQLVSIRARLNDEELAPSQETGERLSQCLLAERMEDAKSSFAVCSTSFDAEDFQQQLLWCRYLLTGSGRIREDLEGNPPVLASGGGAEPNDWNVFYTSKKMKPLVCC